MAMETLLEQGQAFNYVLSLFPSSPIDDGVCWQDSRAYNDLCSIASRSLLLPFCSTSHQFCLNHLTREYHSGNGKVGIGASFRIISSYQPLSLFQRSHRVRNSTGGFSSNPRVSPSQAVRWFQRLYFSVRSSCSRWVRRASSFSSSTFQQVLCPAARRLRPSHPIQQLFLSSSCIISIGLSPQGSSIISHNPCF